MKKIVFLIMLTFFGGIINANECSVSDHINNESIAMLSENGIVEKGYNFTITKRQLGEYLEIDTNNSTQLDDIYKTYGIFCDSMAMAGESDNESARLNLIFHSVDYILFHMREQLNKTQYRKFLVKLNESFNDRGLVAERYLYCERRR